MLRTIAAALIATQLACAHAPAVPVQAAPERDCNIVESERFAFHDDPWINLHHFLYEWARNVPERLADDCRRPVDVPERTQLARLTETEQQACREPLLSIARSSSSAMSRSIAISSH
jgi:hypothetical protein